MKTTLNTKKEALIKQYHTVCSICGLKSTDKEAILLSYSVGSSKHLTETQLMEIIAHLQKEPDAWRKRVMAAIAAWMQRLSIEGDAGYIKAVACRASGYEEFNKIPVSRLTDVYYSFVRKAKAAATSAEIQKDIVDNLTIRN
jgi:hypothetical protein